MQQKVEESVESEGGEDEVYYDEMEYGDELNDQEEKDYAKEKKELPKRATRGLRMSALVGKAQEEDDAFYNGVFGVDEESDKDFNLKSDSVDSGRDSFDSDFDDSIEGEPEIDEEGEIVREEKKQKKKLIRRAQGG
jgi:hypothetical protein